MKRIINLVFLLFSITLFSQSEKVNFENELIYERGNNRFLWYVSNKYPSIVLVRDTYAYDSKDFLFYLGKVSYYSLNENNEIEYNKLEFQDETINKVIKITKSEKTEVINGFKCEKFIVNTKDELYEVFISNNSKINNIDYLNKLILNNDKLIFKSGLIVKINKDNFQFDVELLDIKKSDKSIFVDFDELNLRLNEPNKYLIKSTDVIESVNETVTMDIPRDEEKEEYSENHIFYIAGVHIPPEYPEGLMAFNDFIKENLQKPKDLPEDSKGKVFVSFVIEKDGSLSDIKILRDIGYGTAEEVIRVLKLSKKWKPGFVNDRPVRVAYTYPVTIN